MANKKLTTCKACGAEVAKSAKTCPHCGAKVKKGHPILTGIIIFIVLVAIIGSSGGSDEPQKVETPQNVATSGQEQTSTNTPKEEEKTEFFVGETAELKGVNVSFVSVNESTGSAYNKPTDGNVFVLCEFEIANNSDREINISSMMSFEAYCDDYRNRIRSFCRYHKRSDFKRREMVS